MPTLTFYGGISLENGLTEDAKVKLLIVPPAGAGGGVTDHGALTGLGDDDHPQYLTKTQFATDSIVNALIYG